MDRIVVITGASSGIGLAAAEQFARQGDQVVLVGRTESKLAAARKRVHAAGRIYAPDPYKEPDVRRADFEDLDQVRDLAAELAEAYPRIDVLASNAGGMVAEHRLTRDGYEATMQSNHLAPFLLAGLLHERIGRLVVTASRAHMRGKPGPADLTGRNSSWQAYSKAKAANILFAAEAARRWPGITSVSFHPGVVRSDFGAGRATRFFYRVAGPLLVSPEKAGEQLVWLADNPVVNGAYYVGHQPRQPSRHAADPVRARELWQASAEAVDLGG
ncbi:SDR family NAD(P)-dependent oxidoreductase [Actinoplanes sp. NPDC049596]|uniref:SDR family NAD(P)-dependent oxidoreductase n=1 Tax=unclassified Actinoplanes TaxID=2626549 RepID=UPI00341A042A